MSIDTPKNHDSGDVYSYNGRQGRVIAASTDTMRQEALPGPAPVAAAAAAACDKHCPPLGDPNSRAKQWNDAKEASKNSALQLNPDGTYTAADGDCLSTIAARALRMSGQAVNGKSIAAEEQIIKDLNKDRYPKMADCDTVNIGWHLKLNSDAQPQPAPAPRVEAPPQPPAPPERLDIPVERHRAAPPPPIEPAPAQVAPQPRVEYAPQPEYAPPVQMVNPLAVIGDVVGGVLSSIFAPRYERDWGRPRYERDWDRPRYERGWERPMYEQRPPIGYYSGGYSGNVYDQGYDQGMPMVGGPTIFIGGGGGQRYWAPHRHGR